MRYAAPIDERPRERNRDALRRTAVRVLDGCVRVHALVHDGVQQRRPASASSLSAASGSLIAGVAVGMCGARRTVRLYIRVPRELERRPRSRRRHRLVRCDDGSRDLCGVRQRRMAEWEQHGARASTSLPESHCTAFSNMFADRTRKRIALARVRLAGRVSARRSSTGRATHIAADLRSQMDSIVAGILRRLRCARGRRSRERFVGHKRGGALHAGRHHERDAKLDRVAHEMSERGESVSEVSEPKSLERRGREARGGVEAGALVAGHSEVMQLPEREPRWMNQQRQRTHLIHAVEEDPQRLADMGGPKAEWRTRRRLRCVASLFKTKAQATER
jgi:hypothetical protein